jgi:CubicO group peptidase (beta-lactamase class C family)
VIQRVWLSAALLFLLAGCSDEQTARTGAPAPGSAAAPAVDDARLRIVLANTAKRMCSSVFVGRRTPDHVLAEELRGAAEQNITVAVDDAARTAVARAAGATATVVYRPYLGCTLVQDLTVEALTAQFDASAYPAVAAPESGALWPEGDRVEPGGSADVDMSAVRAAVDQAFAEHDTERLARTRAVVVVHDGRIIAERYAAPFDANMPQLGWSMTKSVTNALTGILVGDGRLETAEPAAVQSWQTDGDARRAITLNDLLQMSSGLAFSEVYTTADAASDVVSMLFGEGAHAMGEFAAAMPLAHEPGTHWSYASGTTNLLSMLHRQTFDTQTAYFAFPRARLFNKLKMASAVIEPDESGVFVGSSYMYATPRDWARIGLLYLQDGVWNGERILPQGWVDYSLKPAAAAPKGQYGAHIWLNRGEPSDPADRPRAELPTDLYHLSGFEGQNVVVVPSRQLIVVRMGLTESGPGVIWGLMRELVEAIDSAG